MFDTLSMRRWYPLLLTALAVAISGCATTMGSGLREGPRVRSHPFHPRDDRRTATDRSPV